MPAHDTEGDTMSWTPENKNELERLWALGWTAEDIAHALGPWCTKGAVCGQVRRMYLPPREYWVLRDRRLAVANENRNVRSATRAQKLVPAL